MHSLGGTELQVSSVILGAWSFGGWFWGGAEDQASVRTIHAAVNHGITTIDTAPVYGFGRSEEVVGRGIKGIRDRVQILTKVGLRWDTEEGAHFFDTEDPEGRAWRITRNLRPDSVRWEVEQSLRRLQVDHIDLVQCHWPDPSTPIPDTMGALSDLVREGKVGAIGVSNFSPDQMTEAAGALGDTPLASNQPRYSLLYRQVEREILPYALENNVGIIVYSPMAMGILTGRVTMDRTFPKGDGRAEDPLYHPDNRRRVIDALEHVRPIAESHDISLANLAVAWVLNQQGVTAALVGARSEQQAQENARAMRVQLTDDDEQHLRSVFEALKIDKRPGNIE